MLGGLYVQSHPVCTWVCMYRGNHSGCLFGKLSKGYWRKRRPNDRERLEIPSRVFVGKKYKIPSEYQILRGSVHLLLWPAISEYGLDSSYAHMGNARSCAGFLELGRREISKTQT